MRPAQLIWDLPLRLFHWLLAALVVASMVTGTLGGNALEWHMRSGYAILTLLVFRLWWGFWGGHHARFATFVRGPAAIVRYLRGQWSERAGHNPLGALSVVAMLGLLLVQGVIGLFANDDVLAEGPLYRLVSKETSDWLTGLHQRNFYALAALLGLHVAAVSYYRLVKRDDLIRPMITGHREVVGDVVEASPPARGSTARAVLFLLLSAGLVWAVVTQL